MYILSSVGEISCSSWPSKSSKNGCKKGIRGDADIFIKLDSGLDISKTEECENLCRVQNDNGCCFLGAKTGCGWLTNGNSYKADTIEGGEEVTSVTCSYGNHLTI